MPGRLHKIIGMVLIFTTIGIACLQALIVSCSSPVNAGADHPADIQPQR